MPPLDLGVLGSWNRMGWNLSDLLLQVPIPHATLTAHLLVILVLPHPDLPITSSFISVLAYLLVLFHPFQLRYL